MVVIRILDPVHSLVNQKGIPKVLPCIEYKSEFWRASRWGGKARSVKRKHLISKGIIFTGLIPRIEAYCKESGYPIRVIRKRSTIKFSPPFIKGVKMDSIQTKEQLSVVSLIKKHKRGVILFPTGSGKTAIAALFISSLKKQKVLFLCHTKDIFFKTEKNFKEYGLTDVSMMGGGLKKDEDKFFSSRISIAMIQSFSKIDPRKYCPHFDVVIIDEAHNINSISSQYGNVIQHMLAPIRLGFTATLPDSGQGKLSLEGLVGPVIATMSEKVAVDKKILAKPIINLISVPYNTKFGKDLYRFRDIYETCVINSRVRNKLIIDEVKKFSDKGMTSLILIKEISHGEQLFKMAELESLKVKFIHGGTENGQREKVAELLYKKEVLCVIASVIWKEGIDIPSLNHVVNAFGGRAETPTVQVSGRGARTDAGKKEVFYVTDFLDPYKFLAQHTVFRLQTYKMKGWLNN